MVKSRLWQWQLALGICAVAILLCIFYVDRPVADFVNTHVGPAITMTSIQRAPTGILSRGTEIANFASIFFNDFPHFNCCFIAH